MTSSPDLLRRLGAFWTGRLEPVKDATGQVAPRSLCEKRFLDVNGTRQGIFLRGTDVDNPVLLYLHGGLPEYFLTEGRPTPLEDHFTVAWWDQRGAGLSYDPSTPGTSVTTEQCILDTFSGPGLFKTLPTSH